MSLNVSTLSQGSISINKTCVPHKLRGCKHLVE